MERVSNYAIANRQVTRCSISAKHNTTPAFSPYHTFLKSKSFAEVSFEYCSGENPLLHSRTGPEENGNWSPMLERFYERPSPFWYQNRDTGLHTAGN